MKPLTITGLDKTRSVTFSPPLFLAPMEGVTEPCFRDMVINLGGVGGACTEFIRISQNPTPVHLIERYLGPLRSDCVVGAQLMAPDVTHIEESTRNTEIAGAAFIDLNFGCPVPTVFQKCAGSALLGKPELLHKIVSMAVRSVSTPVTAKIRAGIDSPSQLKELVLSVAEAGAAMLTLHARLRIHSYSHPSTWEWINVAKETLLREKKEMPLIGNGSVEEPALIERMMSETGCDGVMIGRGALADPWIFARYAGKQSVSVAEAARFAFQYAKNIETTYSDRRAIAKLKQLLKYFQAGPLIESEEERRSLLRETSLERLYEWLRMREGSGLKPWVITDEALFGGDRAEAQMRSPSE
jgi:tRNA-dihydrouridine synthase C